MDAKRDYAIGEPDKKDFIMQPHHLLWSTIVGYMLVAVTISIITSLWIRHHLKQFDIGASCSLKQVPLNLKKFKK